ncbi:MAG TPA: YfhO family protein [Gemmatimonadales bacterium]|nr:YfhO family protein [Gemmatimonadales bacterium]
MLSKVTQRFPVLTAAAIYTAAVSLAFLPFFRGQFLVNAMSDARTGYPGRELAAAYYHANGGILEWMPYTFGGMPFLANTGNGDTFYPTFLLRLVLSPDAGVSLGFMIHLVLAGVFMFLFLRALKLDWGAAFTGGAAYLMSGQIVSLVSPGHDGKLFVSALLPLALYFLVKGVTAGSWRSYVGFGVTVGFALLTPHVQLTYYLLMAAGFFWLYLVFWSGERAPGTSWPVMAACFVGALVLGFAFASIQLMPFFEYITYSPRGAAGSSSTGYEYGTGWSMPPEEVLGTLWPAFMGNLRDYWGRNPFKLHSDYIGVATLMLASFGFRLEGKRRLAWFFVFLAAYGLLFAFGGYTPFYRIPYTLLPGISKTRVPSMIFFLVSFSAAALAAMGVQALQGMEEAARRKRLMVWAGVLGVLTLLAVAGGFQPIMELVADPNRFAGVITNYPNFRLDAVRVLVFALIAAAVLWRRFPQAVWGLALGGVVLLDLWTVERQFIQWTPPAAESFAADGVVQAIQGDSSIFRVLPFGVYDENRNYLMTHRIRSVLGYNGQELHRYDELLGGKNEWKNAGSPSIWRLLAVKYIALPQEIEGAALTKIAGPVTTHDGQQAYVYRYEDAQPFASLVPLAVKTPEDQTIPTLADPRFDGRRFVLVPPDAPVGVAAPPGPVAEIADPVATEMPREGLYRFTFATPAPQDAFLSVSENWYPDWHATVDGKPAEVVRAQFSLMAVPVPAGARQVELTFASAAYRTGRLVTLAIAALLALLLVVDGAVRLRRPRG